MSDLDAIFAELNELDGLYGDSETNWPAVLLSAAYGYSREGRHSLWYAYGFGLLGYMFPVLSAALVAADATLGRATPLRQLAVERAREFHDKALTKHISQLRARRLAR